MTIQTNVAPVNGGAAGAMGTARRVRADVTKAVCDATAGGGTFTSTAVYLPPALAEGSGRLSTGPGVLRLPKMNVVKFPQQYAVPEAIGVTLSAWTSTRKDAQTTDRVDASFYILDDDGLGAWSDPEPFFTGAAQGEAKSRKFTVLGTPAAVRLTIRGADAWGMRKVRRLISPLRPPCSTRARC